MIPTSVTSSSPPTACLGSIGNQINNSPTIIGSAKSANGAGVTGTGQGQGNNSAFLGIASLILEGRALADDEYAIQTPRCDLKTSLSGNPLECGGRQSPKPSTSKAAFGENISTGLVNYLGRKSSNSPESVSPSFLRDYYNSSSSDSASSSVESNHSRWSQKLSQLRQESPNAHHQGMSSRQKVAIECPRGSDAEYVALAINTDHHHYGKNDDRKGGDFEILRRMSINQMNFYNSPNSMGGGGGGGGNGASENFMCSLQSLASNTCLRVASPLLLTTTSPPRYLNNRHISSSAPRYATPQQQLDHSIGTASSSANSGGVSVNSFHTSSSAILANSSSNNSPKSKDYLLRKSSATAQRASIASPQLTTNNTKPLNCVTATTTAATNNRNQTYLQQGPHCDQFLRKMGLAKGDASETEEHHCDMSYVNITCTRWRAYCIKMENILARGESICIEVYLGPVGHKVLLEQWIITQKEKQPPPTMTLPSLCSAIRSQLYFSQISAWCDLIKKSDKTIIDTGRIIYTTPSTTSAAGDLATTTNNAIPIASTATSTTSTHHYPTVMSSFSVASPTVVVGSGGNVCGGVLNVGCAKRRPTSPRLNIFYRIKQYDSTACFNSKPNVHNFPNVNISENCSVSVCLKSLPRITGGIPKVGTSTAQQQAQQTNIPTTATAATEATPMATATTATPPVKSAATATAITTCLAAKNKTTTDTTSKIINSATSVSSSANFNVVVAANTTKTTTITTNANKSTILKMNCDNNLLKEHQQQQKPFTASTTRCCSFSNGKNICEQQQSTLETDLDQELLDIDYECGNELSNIDMSAGGKTSVHQTSGNGMNGANSFGDSDQFNSLFSTNNCAIISHREKQLLKYRKRMLKRDKKQQVRKANDNAFSSSTTFNRTSNHFPNEMATRNNNSKMEQGEDDDYGEDVDDVNGDNDGNSSDTADYSKRNYSVSNSNSLANGQRQRQHLPNNHNNSIPSLQQLQMQQQQQQQHHHHLVKMISTGTQTIANTNCTTCGCEKSLICLKCSPLKSLNSHDNELTTTTTTATLANASDTSYNYEEIMDAETSSVSSLSSSDIIHTPRNKAELLLQAIQRTPKHKSKDSNQLSAIKKKQQQQQLHSPTTSTIMNRNNNSKSMNSDSGGGRNISLSHSNSRSSSTSSIVNGNIANNNSSGSSSSSSSSSNSNMAGCQMCKRQKTQHNFSPTPNEESLVSDDKKLNALNPTSCTTPAAITPSLAKNPTQSVSYTNDDRAATDFNDNNGVQDDDGDADDDGNGGDNDKDGGRIPSSDLSFKIDMVQANPDVPEICSAKSCDKSNENEIMEEEYFESSTKLTPYIDRCSLNMKTTPYDAQVSKANTLAVAVNDADKMEYQLRSCSTPPLRNQTAENVPTNEGTDPKMSQFKTPTASGQHVSEQHLSKTQQPLQPQKHANKPNMLHIACNFNKIVDVQQLTNSNPNNCNTNNPLLLRRSLPKVNLTPIFCNPNSMMAVTSPPMPISNGVCNGTANGGGATAKSAEICVTDASPTFSFEPPASLAAPSITVQKSNSAPTLPNSPSLSPRFIKASAIYKRRSRHLSDRSDRSSLGSDEQFSDEDIDSGMYSPFASSPIKLRTRLAAVFGRKPLLGNLEECLLQRRLVPKIEVMGFKLLLGASGGFCPTQLTIPAAAYFYELKGETLSTPYVCEIRLPRKGYTVPRCGTVQATLLNPVGTVVRMFVIPYDMRDMPTLHQTFIRQRILADAGIQTNNDIKHNGELHQLINNETGDNLDLNLNTKQQQMERELQSECQYNQPLLNGQTQRSSQSNNENQLGHFMSAENMKSLRYSIHLRFQTSRSGRLMLHTDIRLLISRRTDCDTAAAHAKGVLEAPNELITNTVMPTNPKYSARQAPQTSKI